MPPRKEAVSKADLHRILRNHGIRCEGPAPPKQWPCEFKHHFLAIRTLGRTFYDEYKGNTEIPHSQKEHYKETANNLRRGSNYLLGELNPNEATWRDLETMVLQRFTELVVCSNCKDDKWKPSAEAECYYEENQAKLGTKRRQRKCCDCENDKKRRKQTNGTDDRSVLFRSAAEQKVLHATEDNLDHLQLPMKPDRVIGLVAPANLPHDVSLFPCKDMRILLPFLVVEAKRATDAPGFRAIQCQSAFPIRRFLKAQNELMVHNRLYEPPLVWFFGFQGEQWRVHGCVQDKDKVKIYELWQGSIESLDGALQLLLIADYIWSWARDIYDPTMSQLLRDSLGNTRGLSPASTDRFRSSMSVEISSQENDEMSVVEPDIRNGIMPRILEDDVAGSTGNEEPNIAILEEAFDHDFLRWAADHPSCPPWASIGCIRHSDIMQFECLHLIVPVPIFESLNEAEALMSIGIPGQLAKSAFRLTHKQLAKLSSLWIEDTNIIPQCIPQCSGPALVSIALQTMCEPPTWQLKKRLIMVIWCPHVNGRGVVGEADFQRLTQAINHARNFRGAGFILSALGNESMILGPISDPGDLQWISFHIDEPGLDTISVLEYLKDLQQIHRVNLDMTHHSQSWAKIFMVKGSSYIHPDSIFPDLELTWTGRTILAIRPPYWVVTSPKFCLFILSDLDNGALPPFHTLVEEAYASRKICGQSNQGWTQLDQQDLQQWARALRSDPSAAAVSV